MKRLFNKIHFTAELLSNNVIVAGKQNLLKLLISDVISATDISSAQFRISKIVGRDTTEVITWTTLDQDINNTEIFSIQLSPTFTEDSEKNKLEILILDNDGNEYLIESSNVILEVL